MKPIVVLGLLYALLLAVAIVGSILERNWAIKTYNNGIHGNCGGKWELYSASRGRNCPTKYYYKCLKCGENFETECGELKPEGN